MIDSAYYSVPYQLIGEAVEVCMTHSLVRIFHNNQEVAVHEKANKKWEYKRKQEHSPPFKEAVLQCSQDGLLGLAEDIGPYTHQVADNILSHPTVDKLKPVRHMLKLADKFSKERLERAYQRAVNYKIYSYSNVKNILENNLDGQDFETIPKVIPLKQVTRFARNPADYKSSYKVPETFDERLIRLQPFSKHGNAMMKPLDCMLADQLADEGYE